MITTMQARRIAIVTGATGGLGQAFVKFLTQNQEIDEIWAIARNQENLQHLAELFGSKIKPISLDLSEKSSLLELEHQLNDSQVEVLYLINNAGYAKFGGYQDLTLDESLNMIDLNCKAVVGLSLITIPFMHPGSHIINLASQASFQPLPYLNIYAATKAFVLSYSRALNVELGKTKLITVTVACPGWIATNLISNAQTQALIQPTVFKGLVHPDQVASQALKDAQKGRDISIYGWKTKFAYFGAKLFPQKWVMKIWLTQQKIH